MNALWLFLYLGALVQMLTLYRLDLNKPSTLLTLLPILMLPLMNRLLRWLPWLASALALRVAGLVSLGSAVAMARILNLGYWDTTHLGLAALSALVGMGLLVVVRSSTWNGTGLGLWLWIAAWEITGSWHPILPFLGAGLSAGLGGFGFWPESRAEIPASRNVHPFSIMLLLGLVLPKPWFDFNLEGAWAQAMAAFAVAVGVAGLMKVRERLDRIPTAAFALLLAVAFVAYPSAWAVLWAAGVGLVWGALWRRLPKPLSLTPLTLGFLLGLLVSYALHSNLGVPVLRRLIWWGS